MGRDHRIGYGKYYTCPRCGFDVRLSQTIWKRGKRYCPDCYDIGDILPTPNVGWITSRWKTSEYGICTQLEEQGATGAFAIPSAGVGQYGVITKLDRVLTSSLSGEYGTLVYVPDHRI